MASPASSVEDQGYRFPLSPAQRRLWFLENLHPENCAYHIPLAVELEGTIDDFALEDAFRLLIDRHESLRTAFSVDEYNGEPSQFVWLSVPWSLERETAESREEAVALMEQSARKPFRLSRPPLLRATLFRVDAKTSILYVNLHHLICDGWSLGLLVRELGIVYPALARAAEPVLTPLALQYPDYSEWLREQDTVERLNPHREYWRSQLAEAPVLELSGRRARRAEAGGSGGVVSARLSGEIVRRLEEVAGRHGATVFMAGLAAFHALLQRLSGAAEIVIGTPVANRPLADLETVVGLFVNSLPLRIEGRPRDTFGTLLGRVKDVCIAAFEHQELPLEQMTEERGDLSRPHLFQTMFVLQNAPLQNALLEHLTWPGVTVRPLRIHNGTAKVDLILTAEPEEAGLLLSLEYATDLFGRAEAQRVLENYQRLLGKATANPAAVLRDLMGGPACSAPVRDFAVRDLAGWFEEVARERGDAVALVCGDEMVTYAELNRRANAEAFWLRERGVGPEVRVGLCRDRSIDLIVGMLAILKAGGAYVPMDPQYPAARLAYLAQDSGVALVLDGPAQSGQAGNPGIAIHPSQAAYVIYTSGSTGQPKGCVVTHANVSRLLEATRERFGFSSQDVWTMFHSPSFDFSVWEIWGALLTGARLVIVPYMVSRSPEAFWELLRREKVTVLNQTPSAFRQLVNLEEPEPLADLRLILFGGEALEPSSLKRWFARYGDRTELVNMYGITETTVHVTEKRMTADDLTGIGGPLEDLSVYLLDAGLEPVPVGVRGEICVGGAGVARGYLGRPELTAERFVPDPFGPAGSRMYRSGDVARRRSSGDLEYVGRGDQQIKIRGFRIEPGEVEEALRKCAGVREAVVGIVEGRLAAWVVADWLSDLRGQLQATLPEYMVPAAIVPMEEIPLTVHGKIDRRALPEPEWKGAGADTRREPGTPAEHALVRIWKEVLGVGEVGIDDNFFALGGDSILTLQVIGRARRDGLQLKVQDLFETRNIAELALRAVVAESVVAPAAGGLMPLAPIQRWFFSQDIPNRSHWNQSAALGIPDDYSAEQIAQALAAVAPRHDAFRLRYRRANGEWLQEYRGEALFPLEETESEAEIPRIQASLDIDNGPLARAALWREPSGSRILFLTAHHLIVDGVSWRILLEDLTGELAGKPPQAPTGGYGAWVRETLAETQPDCCEQLPAAPENFERDAAEWTIRIPLPERFSGFSRLESFLLDALGQSGDGNTSLPLVRESHGRAGNLDLSRTVGWFTQFLNSQGRPIQIAGPVAALCFNYLGQFSEGSADSGFRLRPEFSRLPRDASAQRPFLVDVVAYAHHGVLTVTWIYGSRIYAENAIQAWAGRFEQHLQDLLLAGYEMPVRPLSSEERFAIRENFGIPVDAVYPLTPLQQGMLFHTVSDGNDSLYFEQVTASIRGPLETGALEQAWNDVLAAHATLRTAFVWRGLAEPLQAVLTQAKANFQEFDFRDKPDQFDRLVDQDRSGGRFALEQAPLMRVSVARTGAETWRLLWSHHHLILDGWSLPLVFLDLLRAYECRARGIAPRLPLSPPFSGYVAWIAGQDAARSEAFWKAELAGFDGPSAIARLKDAPAGALHVHAVVTRSLEPDVMDRLSAAAKEHRVTLNSLVQGAWALLQGQFGPADDVIFGITVSGRVGDVPGIERIPGLFINTLPLRVKIERGANTGDWLRGIQKAQFALQQFTHCRLVDIQRYAGIQQSEALFDSILVFENYPVDEAIAEWRGPISVENIRVRERTNFPLTLGVIPGSQLGLQLNYHENRFAPGVPGRLLDVMVELLDRLARPGHVQLGELLASQDAAEPQAQPRPGLPGHVLFERQAKKTPAATALICGNRQITYADCDDRASVLANRLRNAGIRPGDLIGISLPRSPEFVIAIIGIWKAGAAWVPLDPDLPAERLRFMTEDSGAVLVLGSETDLPPAGSAVPPIDVLPTQLAYVIYTSGSTGSPKGVAVPHVGLENLMRSQIEAFRVRPQSRVLQFARFSFDASVSELLMAFGAGAALVLPEPRSDPYDIAEGLVRQKITHVTLPPSVAAALSPESLPDLKTLVLAGEAAPSELFLRWSDHCRVLNAYGPTEATVCAAMNDSPHREALPTLGDAAGDARITLLSRHLEPVPEGVPGEIVITGPGLAWGYLNQPRLTALAFVPNPWGVPGERMYRSGDLGVYGERSPRIRFAGRGDRQVKVRGHRVELEGIEAVIAAYPGIESAAAIVVETAAGGLGIAAFYRSPAPVEDDALRAWLGRRLTSYQLPASLERVPEWPLTHSGKIDRSRLVVKAPPVENPGLADRDLTAAEASLLEIWREALRLPHASVRDNFFALGGDSIVSLQIASKARRLGFAVSPRDVLSLQTVEALARLAGSAPDGAVEIPANDGPVTLTPIQRWFFAQDLENPHHWNMSLVLECQPVPDLARLESALNHVVKTHDAFRFRFERDGAQWRAFLADAAGPVRIEKPAAAWDDGVAQLQTGLNLTSGPLLRVAFLENRLVFVAHHAVFDAVSWASFLNDVLTLYATGEPPRAAYSFAAWGERLRRSVEAGAWAHELPYWAEVVRQANEIGSLFPEADRSQRANRYRIATRIVLDEEETSRVTGSGFRIPEALLAALTLAVAGVFGPRRFAVELEGHGREERETAVDISRSVGWFTTLYPVVLELPSTDSFESMIAAVRDQLRSVPSGGFGYGLLRWLDPAAAARLSLREPAGVLFNYLGQTSTPGATAAGFRLCDMSAGDEHSPDQPMSHALTVNARIRDERLCVDFATSRRVMSETLLDVLAAAFEARLSAIPAAGGALRDFENAVADQESLLEEIEL